MKIAKIGHLSGGKCEVPHLVPKYICPCQGRKLRHHYMVLKEARRSQQDNNRAVCRNLPSRLTYLMECDYSDPLTPRRV